MRPVRQKYKSGVKSTAARTAFTALASGCAESASPQARPAPGRQQGLHAPAARSLGSCATRLRQERAARVAAASSWGPRAVPPTAPPASAGKPAVRARDGFEVTRQEEFGPPPVLTTVPTKDEVDFRAIDDGSEKDPACPRMMSDLEVPRTASLSNCLVKNDYGYRRFLAEVTDKGYASARLEDYR